MKRMFCIFIILFTIGALISSNNVYAEGNDNQIDISTSPHKVFFNIINLKPGDRVLKTLTVSNNGKEDFNYLFSNMFLTGSEEFYNQLRLKISKDNKVLFDGQLKDFKKLEPRSLKKGTSENLSIYVEIPYELNNKYQGLGSEFQFKFYVDGTLGGILPANGPKLPDTGTNIYNILVSGFILLVIGLMLQVFLKIKGKKGSPL